MRTLLPKKEKYYKEFADVVNKTYRQMRYGIAACKPSAISVCMSTNFDCTNWVAAIGLLNMIRSNAYCLAVEKQNSAAPKTPHEIP